MNKTYIIGGVILLLVFSVVGFLVFSSQSIMTDYALGVVTPVPTTTPPVPTPTPASVLPYGEVSLGLQQVAVFAGISLSPLSIEEDSRCPEDVQCIQAGTVRVNVEMVTGSGTTTEILKLEETLIREEKEITLRHVAPNMNSQITLMEPDYQFVFTVIPQEVVQAPVAKGKCYVGGCSSQICSDRQDIVSTCEYREAYACYKTAKCERQSTGACGWTETTELSSCLSKSSVAQ